MACSKLGAVRSCYLCGVQSDLRPYGPRGEMVCFKCAFSTPERTSETEQMFAKHLEAYTVMSIDGSESGPVPFNKAQDKLQ